MALFNVLVRTELRLDPAERQAVASIAASLRALVEKLNEPDPPEVPGELHDAIGETAQAAGEVKDAITNPGPGA